MEVKKLPPGRVNEAIDVLCEAFVDYPVMRFVIGRGGNAYAQQLRAFVRFFTVARYLRNDVVLAVTTAEDEVVATANVVLPGERRAPAVLEEERDAVWGQLGDAARRRYEVYGEGSRKFEIDQPHYHLAMVGVRRSHTGRGLARALLEALHEMSRRDSGSCGVTLNTEDPSNVPIYEHFGYEVVGQAQVSDDLRTWSFYRADD
jgi:GNAT superfamily N-acetyltransferase